jgi:hypothetical protein
MDNLEAKYRVWLVETIAEAGMDDAECLKEFVMDSIHEFEQKTEISHELYLHLISYVSSNSDCVDQTTLIYCATELWVKCKLLEEDWEALKKN